MEVTPEALFTRRINELIGLSNSRDFYKVLKASAILRQLLIDGTPLVHQANRNIRVKLEFHVDNTFNQKLPSASAILYTPTQMRNLKMIYSKNHKVLSLGQFLILKILGIKNNSFSVKEIIKYASNKQGGVHYDSKQNKEYKQIETLLSPLNALNVPTLAIAINTIIDITILALKPLKDALTITPAYSNFIAHYDCREKAPFKFEGKNWYFVNNMDDQLTDGFGWFSEIELTNQKANGNRYIYHLGTNTNSTSFEFEISIKDSNVLISRARINTSSQLEIKVPNFQNSNVFNSFFTLGITISFKPKIAVMTMYWNGSQIAKTQSKVNRVYKNFDRQTIGARINSKQPGTFKLKELVLLKGDISPSKIDEVNKYFHNNYRK